MIIDTTLNLHMLTKKKLDASVIRSGRSHSFLITMVVKRIGKNHGGLLCSNQRVGYQERDVKRNWVQQHMSVLIRDYELMLDLRKFCKKSVSFLVSFAIDEYLDDITNELVNSIFNCCSSDNYFASNYIIIKKSIDDVICWNIYWGYPNKLNISDPVIVFS